MDIRFGMGFLLLSFLSLVLPSSQQNNQTTASYQISRKPCYVKGQEGTCMFVWECVKTEGTPLGMCMERFMFGSCCAHDLDNDVFPKQPTTVAGLAASQPASLSSNTAGTPTTSTTSILTTLIASTLIPNATPWRTNSTNNETAELEAESTTEPTTPGSSFLPDDETLTTTVFYEHNASTTSTSSDELLSTTSPTHNTVTLSPLPTTTDSTTATSLPTSSPTKTHPSVSTTKPTGSQPTPGPIKLRPKPYRRTTTRRAAIPTVAPGTNSPLTVSTSTGPRNHTLASSLAPPNNAPPAINLLLPNTILYPSTQTNTPPVTSSHSLIPTIQLITTTTLQHPPDVLVALTVPSPFLSPITTEPHSATLTSPIELADTLASINEINATDPIPNPIPTASNTPYYDPYFHGHITTGLSSSTTAEAHSNLPAETSSEKTTTVTTGTTTTTITSTASPIATSLTTKKYTGVVVTVSSVPAVQNTSTTESSSLKPSLNVTPTSYKNTTSTESTRKPILAVTSIPSSYPNIECGVPPILRQQEGRIVGGSNSKFGSWPWQISVRRTSFFGFSSTHRCGGALLNELWVVTAGHCVEDLLVSQIRLRMGEFDFSTVQEPYPFVERGVNKKIVHPKYNFFTYEYDLALVRLEEPITFQPNIAPICLPATDESLIGQNGTVTGWGRLSEGGTLPSMLQQVTVPIVSNDKCKDMFLKAGRHEYIPDIFMCAGFEEGGRDSCQGDSGGPLQIRGRDGKYFLAGIISWGIGCAEANLPGVCTRISKFTSWILENVT